VAGSAGIDPERIDELMRHGFARVEQFCVHHDETVSPARWRGRMRTCNGVGSGGLAPPEVLRIDAALGRLLGERYPEPLVVPHRAWCAVGRAPWCTVARGTGPPAVGRRCPSGAQARASGTLGS
jgi:hypothetical protein